MNPGKTMVWDGQEYVTCEELIGLLHDYLAGDLPADRRRRARPPPVDLRLLRRLPRLVP